MAAILRASAYDDPFMIPADEAHRTELAARAQRGERFKFLCFWGATPERPGQIDRACLSQWYESPFVEDGLTFATAEHYMMHGKAKLFGDATIAARVLADPRPAVAKKLGREVRDFDEARWIEHRFPLIVRGNILKFGQHAELGAFLQRTGAKVLVEASPTDRIWGVGLAANDDAIEDPARWRGLNLLGFALMKARTALATG